MINFIGSFLFQNKPMQALLAEAEVIGALDPGGSFSEPEAGSGVLGVSL